MLWGIGITTSPRKSGSDYLTPTVQSLKRAGWDDCNIFVFAEPGSPVADGAVVTVHNESTYGPWKNWRESLHRLLVFAPDAHMYAVIQDDLQIRPGARLYTERTMFREPAGNSPRADHLIPAIYSLYTSKHDHVDGPDGWFTSHAGWNSCGACFYAMHPEIAKHLDDSLPAAVRNNRNIDAHFVSNVKALRYKMYWHRPSLVEHMADADSTCGHAKNPKIRVARGFIDEEIR